MMTTLTMKHMGVFDFEVDSKSILRNIRIFLKTDAPVQVKVSLNRDGVVRCLTLTQFLRNIFENVPE